MDENEELIAALYSEVLNRAPSEKEFRHWVGVLESGKSPGSVATAFYKSAEYQATKERRSRHTDNRAAADWSSDTSIFSRLRLQECFSKMRLLTIGRTANSIPTAFLGEGLALTFALHDRECSHAKSTIRVRDGAI